MTVRNLPMHVGLLQNILKSVLQMQKGVTTNTICARCREIMPRGPYSRIAQAVRTRTVRLANNGGNWRDLAEQLGVNYKTAYTWIRNDAESPKPRGGSQKKLTDAQIDHVVALV